jgi:hypothetical protein
VRVLWLCSLVLLVLPSLLWAGNGSYLVGSIGLAEVSVGELGSAAEIDCYDFWGNLADICRFGGTHHIANDSTGHLIAHESFEAFGSSWINFLRGIGGGGRCFRARVNGAIIGGTYSQAWGSQRVCPTDPPEKPPTTDSPLLIDLDGNGFHLTGLSNPVTFDIDADGNLDTLAWTQAGSDDAFLALDLDGNGQIDDGRELFGNHSLLSDGTTAENGYVALARYDEILEGGNEDGFVNEQDLIYGRLLMWADMDHNGQSSTSELMRVADKVARINLRYHESRRQDEHGNSFRYVSRALLQATRGARSVLTSDVFFRVQQ